MEKTIKKQKHKFDVDGTILIPNWQEENEFFKANLCINNIRELLDKKHELLIEKNYKRYCIEEMFLHFTHHVYPLSVDFITKWISFTENKMKSEMFLSMHKLLFLLKQGSKELVVLSNWFTNAQKARLKRELLLPFFDFIQGEDIILNPNKESYINACGVTSIEDCIMMGG